MLIKLNKEDAAFILESLNSDVFDTLFYISDSDKRIKRRSLKRCRNLITKDNIAHYVYGTSFKNLAYQLRKMDAWPEPERGISNNPSGKSKRELNASS